MLNLKHLHLPALVVLPVFGTAAFAQNALDLEEAAARETAYQLLAQVGKRFECDFAEESMQSLGEDRFVVRVHASGEDCDDAMTHLVSLANQDDKLIFRRGDDPDDPVEPQPFIPPNALIHEVNPEVDEEEILRDEDTQPDSEPRNNGGR